MLCDFQINIVEATKEVKEQNARWIWCGFLVEVHDLYLSSMNYNIIRIPKTFLGHDWISKSMYKSVLLNRLVKVLSLAFSLPQIASNKLLSATLLQAAVKAVKEGATSDQNGELNDNISKDNPTGIPQLVRKIIGSGNYSLDLSGTILSKEVEERESEFSTWMGGLPKEESVPSSGVAALELVYSSPFGNIVW